MAPDDILNDLVATYDLFDWWMTEEGILFCIADYAPRETQTEILGTIEEQGYTWHHERTKHDWQYYRLKT